MSTILFMFGSGELTGAQRMGLTFARAARAAGHRVLGCCGPSAGAGPGVADALAGSGVAVHAEDGFDRGLDLTLVRRVARLIRAEAVDVAVSMVQNDLKITGWAARAAGRPAVASLQNVTTFGGRGAVQRAKRWAYGVTLRRTIVRSVCSSSAVRDDHVNGFGYPADRAEVLANGIDLSRFVAEPDGRTQAVRAALGVRPADLLLVNVGRLDRQKGQHVLIEAFAGLAARDPRVKLVLVGDGPPGGTDRYAADLKAAAAERRLTGRLVFAGWRDDVPLLLAAADAYVHSALWEGLPLAVCEAMAAGLPVVATDCAGQLPGFREGVHGFTVRAGDAAALASAMAAVVAAGPDARASMGRAARTLAESTYDAAAIGRSFTNTLEAVIAGAGARRHRPAEIARAS